MVGKILLGIAVFYGIIIVAGLLMQVIDGRRMDRALAEFREIELAHPYSARDHCPHRMVRLGQSGVPGVVAMTTKWCRVCRASLGPATLKRGLFGSYWT